MRSISGFFGAAGRRRPSGAAPSANSAGRPSADDDLDAAVEQMGVQVAHLLLGDLDLLEAGGDLLEGQEAALLAVGDQAAQLLDLEERRLGLLGQQCYAFVFSVNPSLLQRRCPRSRGLAVARLFASAACTARG